MVDDAYLDIVAADETKSREQGLRVFLDPDTGARGASQTPSAIHDRHRALIAAMRAHAVSLRRDIAPASSLPPLDEHAAGRGRPWLESVRLCAASGAVLWADDVMVRATARQNNLRAFSTSALIDALRARHLLTNSQCEDATSALIRAHIGDFPPDRSRLELLYRQSEDGRDAIDAVTAKPAFWLHTEAESVFFSLLGHARLDSTRRVATLVGNAILGIIRANAPLRASYVVAVGFLARVLLEPGMPAHVPAVLEAARQALLQAPSPLPDPLGPVAKRILDEQAQSHTQTYAAAVLNGLTVECSEGDRRTIRLVILSI